MHTCQTDVTSPNKSHAAVVDRQSRREREGEGVTAAAGQTLVADGTLTRGVTARWGGGNRGQSAFCQRYTLVLSVFVCVRVFRKARMDHTRLYSFKLSWRIVSLTAANTNLMLDVSVAHVKWV